MCCFLFPDLRLAPAEALQYSRVLLHVKVDRGTKKDSILSFFAWRPVRSVAVWDRTGGCSAFTGALQMAFL